MCISWPRLSNGHFAPFLKDNVGCPISTSTFHKAPQHCTQLIIQMPYLSRKVCKLCKSCQYHLLQFVRALSREGQGQRPAPCREESPQQLGSALLLSATGNGRGALLHLSQACFLGSSQFFFDTITFIQLVFR